MRGFLLAAAVAGLAFADLALAGGATAASRVSAACSSPSSTTTSTRSRQDFLAAAGAPREEGRLRRARRRARHAGRARLVDAQHRQDLPRVAGAGDRLRQPGGSSADSAGAVIGEAADVLAMAPQTNIGSSTPISTNGQDFSKDLRRKIVNDAAAYISRARARARPERGGRRGDGAAGGELRRARGRREEHRRRRRRRRCRRCCDEIDGRVTKPKGIELDTAGATRRHGRDVLLPEGARPPDRSEHHRPDALARDRRPAGRAVEPRPGPPGHGRRDLAASSGSTGSRCCPSRSPGC